MPRRALAPISGNIPHHKELTPYKRGVVVGFNLAGVTVSLITIALNLPESTVQDTLRNAPQRPQGLSIAQIGRPLEYSE